MLVEEEKNKNGEGGRVTGTQRVRESSNMR